MESHIRLRRGIIFILSAPSGAGKTTISHEAVGRIEGLGSSISITTRPPRDGERAGIDYNFVSDQEFETRIVAGDFAEYARVFDANYGTPRAPLERAIAQGYDMLLDVDVQGAKQIKAKYPSDAVMIFVLPPSFAELEERLRRRGTENEAAIERRLRRAHQEASAYPNYDYLIINAAVADSLAKLETIVNAERLKVSRLLESAVPWKT
jgi:guanylate kinase